MPVAPVDNLLAVTVTSRRLEGETVAILTLAAADGSALPSFEAGAHIDLHLSENLVRPYSLCNDPTRSGDYKVAIAITETSKGGGVAIHRLMVGDSLLISAPRNNFPLLPTPGRAVLIAGGIGVTPLLAMAHTMAADGATFELHYCVRSPDRAAFEAERALPSLAPFVSVYCDDAPSGQRFAVDRVLADPHPDDRLYLCGPEGFMAFIAGTAEFLGWDPSQIHLELFSQTIDLTGPRFQLRAQRSGVTVEVQSGESIAQVLRREGVKVRLSCENGLCGSCLAPVLEGVPDHRDRYLSGEQKASGRELTTCCSRSLTPILVLDL